MIVLHDEIDLPFGEIRVRLGGGLAGHNGLKSVKQGLGSADFVRVRAGVGRPPTTDPDRVAAYVLGRFRSPPRDVQSWSATRPTPPSACIERRSAGDCKVARSPGD